MAAAMTKLLATYTVSNTNDNGTGSLRQAITDANAHPGTDAISFNMPGSGVHTVAPTSSLPTITDSVTIDGTTQPGFAGSPLIELNGENTGASGDGLTTIAGSSTISGLVVNRFRGSGIVVQINGENSIVGNLFGTNAGGTAALGNGTGISINESPNNVIGGRRQPH